ncbi:MAG: glycosyltransferase [Spirochaetaceae bacterium]|nr:MAG: glycosyltransferase [Spirochaetaceae bacterium]
MRQGNAMNDAAIEQLSTAQFNDAFRPIMDGVGGCVENYARWLNARYGQCTVVAPRVPGYVDLQPYTVLRFHSVAFPPMRPYRIGVPWCDGRFLRTLRNARWELVHAHAPFVAGTLALQTARRLGIPIVATFHSKYREDFLKVLGSQRLAQLAARRIVSFFHSVDQVWAPNSATADTLRSYGFNGPVQIVPNGSDLAVPAPHELEQYRAQADSELQLEPGVPLYLFVGQHRWEKNVRLIIEALELLLRRGRRFRMLFVGAGYAAGEMQRLVRNRGLADRVGFLGLITDRERLKPLYARADIFLFPSLYDNAPLVMREAAAFSCPAVLVAGSTAAENTVHGENAFLIENRAESLCHLLDHLADRPHLVARAGTGARETIYLPWDQVVDEVYLRYLDLRTHYHRNRGTFQFA